MNETFIAKLRRHAADPLPVAMELTWRALKAMWRAWRRLELRRKLKRTLAIGLKASDQQRIDVDVERRYLAKWLPLDPRTNADWYRLCAGFSGVNSADYCSEIAYYLHIEPILNDHQVRFFYGNKSMYRLFVDPRVLPRTIAHNINGHLVDDSGARLSPQAFADRLAEVGSLIVKPNLLTGGGKNVRVFRDREGRKVSGQGETLDLDFLARVYRRNYLVQERIEQAAYFAALNESSLNTMRLLTYRSVETDEVAVLHGLLRMGGPGSDVDNASAGGCYCAIAPDGTLSARGRTMAMDMVDLSPSGKLRFADAPPIPGYDRVQAFAKSVAASIPHNRIIGMDIAVDRDDRVRLIEMNFRSAAIMVHQLFGRSLFGPFTDEVIAYCLTSPQPQTAMSNGIVLP